MGQAAKSHRMSVKDTPWAQYVVGIGAVGIALLLRWYLSPFLGDQTPFLFLFMVLGILLVKVKPGPFIAASVTAWIASSISFLPLNWNNPEQQERHVLQIFLFAGCLIAASFTTYWDHKSRSIAREASAAQRRTHTEMTDFFDNASVGLHWVGPDGIILNANRAELALLGYEREEYVGRHIADFHADKEKIQDILARLTRAEILRDYPARLIRNDGSEIEVLIDSSVLFEDGKFIHTRCFTRDVSMLHHAETTSTLLAAIVETSDDAIVCKTLDGRIQTWNSGAEKLFGYTAEEAIGHSINIIIPPELRGTETLILQKIAQGIRIEPFEAERMTKAGKRVTVSLSISPVRDKLGNIIGASKMARDATKTRQAEQRAMFLAEASAAVAALEDYEKTLQRVAQIAVPAFADWCAVDLVNSEGTLIRVATFHSDPLKMALAEELQRIYSPDPHSNAGVWKIINSGQSQLLPEITEKMIHEAIEEGALRDIVLALGLKSYIGVPLTARNQVIGVLTFVHAESGRQYDQTDLGVAEDLAFRAAIAIENARLFAETKRNEKRKDEFLAVLAHELRNPLAPLRTAISILERSENRDKELIEIREIMKRQVDQMVHLVDDLLDVSRITRDKLDLRVAGCELGPIIENAAETSRAQSGCDGSRIEVTLPDEPIYLSADSMRLAQVFSNLLNNACKFSDSGTRVSISAKLDCGIASIFVTDEGIGIPPDKTAAIFEMFSQLNAQEDRSRSGLGIGLTLVKRIVEMHAGTIEVNSEGIGKGSTFVVRLPAIAQGATELSACDARPTSELYKLKILIVDDNLDAASTLRLLLTLSGYEVRTESNGDDAIVAVAEFGPDVILLDIGLPTIDGFETCRQIRRLPEGSRTYIFALTGWGQADDRRKSAEAGFDHHLVKPVDTADLLNMISELGSLREA